MPDPTPRAPPNGHTLFFYGTLLAPPVLYRVIFGSPRPDPAFHPSMKTLVFRSALLDGHRRHKVYGADYPAILPEEGGSVRGTVVTGLTEGDRWRLDVFEGSQYTRRVVKVRVFKDLKLDEAVSEAKHEGERDEGRVVQAETYVWSNPRDELEEEEWDFEEFRREKMSMWMGESVRSWDDVETYGEDGNVVEKEVVEVDEGFADVDRAVAERERSEKDGNGHVKDPTGGRGTNGFITRQLQEMRGQA